MLNNQDIKLSNNPPFVNLIASIMEKYEIEEIIETGTARGNGSSLVFAKYNIPMITIECDYGNYREAVVNLSSFSNVKVLNALSLEKHRLIDFILHHDYSKYSEDVIQDSTDPVGFYINEIDKDVEDDVLWDLINNDKKQLIFLDSAGGVGYAEYLKVMELGDKLKNKILVLDDINHVKHYDSFNELSEKYKTIKSEDGRTGYCVFDENM